MLDFLSTPALLGSIMGLFGRTPYEVVLNASLLAITGYFIYRYAVAPFVRTVAGMSRFFLQAGHMGSYLEITPPSQAQTSPEATQQLIAVLQQVITARGRLSLEIAATHEYGIRYLIYCPPPRIATLRRQLAAHLPDARFRVFEKLEEEPRPAAYRYLQEMKQTSHYGYALTTPGYLERADVAAYIVGAMTKLEAGETIVMQNVITPWHSHKTTRLAGKIRTSGQADLDSPLRWVGNRHGWVWMSAVVVGLLSRSVTMTAEWIGFLLLGTLVVSRRRTSPDASAAQRDITTGVLEKLSQPLFLVDMRFMITAHSTDRLQDLSLGLTSSLAPLCTELQSLRSSRLAATRLGQRFTYYKLRRRLPSLWAPGANKLSATELASLYHFPYGTLTTEDLVRSRSKTLPAPRSLKHHLEYDILVGRNQHHGQTTPIGLTAAERQRHVYIIGGTGNGKTTLMTGAMIQDIRGGKGIAFIDPHGDAAEAILRTIPPERINDVIYFNPSDFGRPIGLNLLELTPGLTGDALMHEKDIVTSAVISVFRKIFSEEGDGGHRIEYVLRNAVQTALTQQGATLFTVFDLLNDPGYRKQVVRGLEDKDLKNFWQFEIGKAGDFQRVKMAAGITAKIGRFLFSASAKRIIEQPKSTINFDDILSSGKILICNFSKGLLGEDTSELFGIMVLAKLQMAANRRALIKQIDRRPFYLYVDEFQNFATTSFVQMMSEARKYQLFMTLAEQSTSQQKDQLMVQVILANVGTLICFRTGNPADETLMLPFFSPYVTQGEISNLPAYNFYMRIAGVNTQEPLSGETTLPEDEGSDATAREVTRRSAQVFGRKYVPQNPITPVASPTLTPAQLIHQPANGSTPNRRPIKKHKVRT